MAKKASVLSNGLPVPSKIKLCKRWAGYQMTNRMVTNTSGVCQYLVSFKQPGNRKYAYQTMVRTRFRSAKTGSYTAWSDFKPTRSVALSASARKFNVGAGLPFPAGTTTLAKTSTVHANYWLTANTGYSTGSDYKTAIPLTSVTLPDVNSEMQIQVCVRTYDAANYLHGNWAYSEVLTIARRFVSRSENYYRSLNGGLLIKMNVHKSDLGSNLVIESIKDAKGRSLISKTCYPSISAKRDGSTDYYDCNATIPRSLLKRNITYGETLYVNGRYKARNGSEIVLYRGVRVDYKNLFFDGVNLRAAYDEEYGTLTVWGARKDAHDVIHQASCNLTYVYNGKRYSVAPTSAQKSFVGTQGTTKAFAKFVFKGVPNVISDTKVSFGVNYYNGEIRNALFTLTGNFGGNLFIFNNITYRGANASCWLEGKITQGIKGRSAIRLPEGSQLPFATIRGGRSNALTFTGVVLDEDPKFKSAARAKWEALAEKGACICEVVSPVGHKKRVLVESVTIEQIRKGYAAVSVNMQEVRP